MSSGGLQDMFPRASDASQSASVPNKLSCARCRHRKIKCNRLYPCDHCTEATAECVFPSRRPRRKKDNGSSARDAELLRRVRQLESILKTIGPSPDSAEANQHLQELSGRAKSTSSEPQAGLSYVNFPGDHPDENSSIEATYIRAVRKQNSASRRISGDLWEGLVNEFDGLRSILERPEASDDDELDEGSYRMADVDADSPASFPIGVQTPLHDVQSYYPSQAHRLLLVTIYYRNVNPIFAVFHRSIAHAHMAAWDSLLDPATGRVKYAALESCIFSIFLAATTTISADECLEQFGEEKDELILRYKRVTEHSLIAADFMNSRQIQPLQAFTVYLMVLGSTRFASSCWALSSLAVRMAHGLGIHRDGDGLNFPLHEQQTRRRLWWNVMLLDLKVSAERGTEPGIKADSFNTARPININDEDYSPFDDRAHVVERRGITDMTMALLLIDGANTARTVSFSSTFGGTAPLAAEEKERIVRACFDRTAQIYLADADKNDPNTWVARMLGRYLVIRLSLSIQYGDQGLLKGVRRYPREQVLRLATEYLQIIAAFEDDERAAGFMWYLKTTVPTHPLAIILVEICNHTTEPVAGQAWSLIQRRWNAWKERVAETREDTLWRPLQRLYRRAQAARQEMKARTATNQNVLHDPSASRSRTEHWPVNPPSDIPVGTIGEAPILQLDPISSGIRNIDFGDIPQDNSQLQDLMSTSSFLPEPDFTTYDMMQPDRSVDWSADWSQYPVDLDANDASVPMSMDFNDVWPYQML